MSYRIHAQLKAKSATVPEGIKAKTPQRINHNAKQCKSQLGKAYALSI